MIAALQTLVLWLRLAGMIFTHRPVRVARGIWLQAPWGTKQEAIDAAVAAFLRNHKRG